ncbi:putative pectin methylesterase cgr3 [Quercus suber]|uniref:Pectin methylesterase cgr3 n=1 Tax=Quercus suber TaxID=58331 RepID=A0AAW0JXJ4_QUESU
MPWSVSRVWSDWVVACRSWFSWVWFDWIVACGSMGFVDVGRWVVACGLVRGYGWWVTAWVMVVGLMGHDVGCYPGQRRVKGAELSKFGRPAKLRSSSWWIRYFVQNRLEENEAASKKFEQASTKRSYKPACQVFHLKSHN